MADRWSPSETSVHSLSIVVPVYRGEKTLPTLAREVSALTEPQMTPAGRRFRVLEIVLVNDGAVDGSEQVMQGLAEESAFVRTVWLSRNFGQHAATLAGMASTSGEWVVTMDEDCMHNPADIGALLDVALDTGTQVVYGVPVELPRHGVLRNLGSRVAKRVFRMLIGDVASGEFSSFRLVDGEIGRSLAAYCGPGVYLDVALSWVAAGTASRVVRYRTDERRPSGYSARRLLSHFWRLVVTSGVMPLRFVALLGLMAVAAGVVISGWALWAWSTGHVHVQGWTSIVILFCLFAGTTLFALGVIAEYLGVALGVAMGRPLYLTVSRPPRHRSR